MLFSTSKGLAYKKGKNAQEAAIRITDQGKYLNATLSISADNLPKPECSAPNDLKLDVPK